MASTNLPVTGPFNASIASSRLFTKLSGKLRNIIWKFALVGPHAIQFTRQGVQEPGLLTTCRLVRAEAGSVFYHENNSNLNCENFDSTSVVLAERKAELFSMRLRDPLFRYRVRLSITGTPHWANYILWMRRLHGQHKLCYSRITPNGTLGKVSLWTMSQIVKTMRTEPWAKVEQLLKLHRPMLVKCNSAWGGEHDQDS
ncbi:hypothetical protein LTR95_012826 [Oleoguttula sp. CCFEE 5521]